MGAGPGVIDKTSVRGRGSWKLLAGMKGLINCACALVKLLTNLKNPTCQWDIYIHGHHQRYCYLYSIGQRKGGFRPLTTLRWLSDSQPIHSLPLWSLCKCILCWWKILRSLSIYGNVSLVWHVMSPQPHPPVLQICKLQLDCLLFKYKLSRFLYSPHISHVYKVLVLYISMGKWCSVYVQGAQAHC